MATFTANKLKNWDFDVEQRMMLDVSVMRDERQIYTNLGLNDTVIREGPISHVIHLKISSDGRHLADIAGDGVIVASPTGSTAYSLSAGGPVVETTAQNFIISPICAHSVVSKSFVLSAVGTITVTAADSNRKQIYLSVDGGRAFSLHQDDQVRICRSRYETELLRLTDKSIYQILRMKMTGGVGNEK